METTDKKIKFAQKSEKEYKVKHNKKGCEKPAEQVQTENSSSAKSWLGHRLHALFIWLGRAF